jgi:hypothetical protein
MTTLALTTFESEVAESYQLTPHQAITLCDEFCAYGLETMEQVEDAMFYSTDVSNPLRDFIEFLIHDVGEFNVPTWLVIDYDHTWESNLRHDYYKVTDGESTYFLFAQ